VLVSRKQLYCPSERR